MILTTEGLGHPQFGVKYKKIQVKRVYILRVDSCVPTASRFRAWLLHRLRVPSGEWAKVCGWAEGAHVDMKKEEAACLPFVLKRNPAGDHC
jgi:hypothetical protein